MGTDYSNITVGFTGSGGTGKTTTARALAKHLDIPFHPSVVRAVFEKWGIKESSQRDMGVQDLLNIQMEIFNQRRLQIIENPYGVFDRTLLDCLTYTLYRCGEVISEHAYNELVQKVLHDLDRHTRVFYTPLITFEGSDDDFRESSFGYRATIDLINLGFQKYIGSGNIVALPVYSVADRILYCKKVLNER